MLSKTIGICVVVIFANAFGMKMASHYTDVAKVASERLSSSVSASGKVATPSIR